VCDNDDLASTGLDSLDTWEFEHVFRRARGEAQCDAPVVLAQFIQRQVGRKLATIKDADSIRDTLYLGDLNTVVPSPAMPVNV
jgi:hypothetical protein